MSETCPVAHPYDAAGHQHPYNHTTFADEAIPQLLHCPKDSSSQLEDPYMPRFSIAATEDAPEGTTLANWAARHKEMSVLEQHVAFFDRDGDGVIWPSDTFRCFRDLGYNIFLQFFAAITLNICASYATSKSWIPDPFFRIQVRNIHCAKHQSDTGVYDAEGRFIPGKFEEIFVKYDREGKGGITLWDGLRMLWANWSEKDMLGWISEFFELAATYILVWPKDGIVTREALRRTYDGSMFFEVAEREKHRTRWRAPFSGFTTENVPGKTI